MTKRHADTETVADLIRLRKENDQLREGNEMLKRMVDELLLETFHALEKSILGKSKHGEDYVRLKEENEALKKQMEEIVDVVADLQDEKTWLWEVLSLHRLTFNNYAKYNPNAKLPELIYPERPEKRRPEFELKEDPRWRALK